MKRTIKVFIGCLLYFSSTHLFAQAHPNLKPFTQNLALAKANESAISDLLDTTVRRFLSIANDTSSDVHKIIRNEFSDAKASGHLQSYIYPRRLKRNDVTVQVVNWSDENGLMGKDSVYDSQSLDAIVLIPVMYEDQHGQSMMSLGFTTDLGIYDASQQDSQIQHPAITFKIKKIDSF